MEENIWWFTRLNIRSWASFILLRTYSENGYQKQIFSLKITIQLNSIYFNKESRHICNCSASPHSYMYVSIGHFLWKYRTEKITISKLPCAYPSGLPEYQSVCPSVGLYPFPAVAWSAVLPFSLLQFPPILRGLAKCLSFSVFIFRSACYRSVYLPLFADFPSPCLLVPSLEEHPASFFRLLHSCPFPPPAPLPHSSRRPPETFAYSITVFHPARRPRSPL